MRLLSPKLSWPGASREQRKQKSTLLNCPLTTLLQLHCGAMSNAHRPGYSNFAAIVSGAFTIKSTIVRTAYHFNLDCRTRRHAASLSNPNQVIFSGIQPTGVPHLGNYFGALHQWVKIQDGAPSTTDLLFSIVDLHAMTLPYDRNELRLQKRQTLAALLAIGLNPQRSTIFFQSAV